MNPVSVWCLRQKRYHSVSAVVRNLRTSLPSNPHHALLVTSSAEWLTIGGR